MPGVTCCQTTGGHLAEGRRVSQLLHHEDGPRRHPHRLTIVHPVPLNPEVCLIWIESPKWKARALILFIAIERELSRIESLAEKTAHRCVVQVRQANTRGRVTLEGLSHSTYQSLARGRPLTSKG